MRGRPYIGEGDPVARGGRQASPVAPVGGALGRPSRGRQAPLSPFGGATSPPFCFGRGLRCKFEEKKLQLGPVAPIGRPEVFLKFFKTDIYFWNFNFFKYKKEKSPVELVLLPSTSRPNHQAPPEAGDETGGGRAGGSERDVG